MENGEASVGDDKDTVGGAGGKGGKGGADGETGADGEAGAGCVAGAGGAGGEGGGWDRFMVVVGGVALPVEFRISD